MGAVRRVRFIGWPSASLESGLCSLSRRSRKPSAKRREATQGNESSGLSAKEAQEALTIREVLAAYRQETGRRLLALEAVASYIAAVKLLPSGDTLAEVSASITAAQ